MLNRRRVLLGLALALPALACGQAEQHVGQAPSPATPSFNPPPLVPSPNPQPTSQSATLQNLTPTPAQTEGPYYKAGSPQRPSLREGLQGTPLILTGAVSDRNGRPVPNAWLDFWQADAQGNYDNSGYRLRGHVFANDSGRFTIETIIPGEYPGRTPHIHVKVRAGNGPVLTTQLYLPDAPGNQRDGIFNRALTMKVQGNTASYDFVLG